MKESQLRSRSKPSNGVVIDPFDLETMDQNLFVTSIPPMHSLVLNKFPSFPNHVTTQFLFSFFLFCCCTHPNNFSTRQSLQQINFNHKAPLYHMKILMLGIGVFFKSMDLGFIIVILSLVPLNLINTYN